MSQKYLEYQDLLKKGPYVEAAPSLNLGKIASVRPETRIFVRDQGLRKILPQAYS